MTSELAKIKSKIMAALLETAVPLSLEDIVENPELIHERAVRLLIREDKITTSGLRGKYELL